MPDYIERLIAHNDAKRKAKGGRRLFENEKHVTAEEEELIPDVAVTEEEYRANPLAADVKYWGHWVLQKANKTSSPSIRLTKTSQFQLRTSGHERSSVQTPLAVRQPPSSVNCGFARELGDVSHCVQVLLMTGKLHSRFSTTARSRLTRPRG